MTILVLIGTVFVIICEMFHGRISKLSTSAAASEFSEWVQIRIDVYISLSQALLISMVQLLVLLP